MRELNDMGLTIGERPLSQIFVSSVLAGCYLSFGASMYISLAGGMPALAASMPGLHAISSAMIFPIGMTLITLTKTDLLTSNMLYSSLPLISKDARRSN